MDFGSFYKRNYKPYVFVVLALAALFLFFALVNPGLKLGMDFTGGTLISIDLDKSLDPKEVETKLLAAFPLSNVTVLSRSSSVGYGVNIQYAENTLIADAQKELDLAESLFEQNPLDFQTHAKNAISLVAPYYIPETIPSDNDALLKTARNAIIDAKTNFDKQLQAFLVKEFDLPEALAFQKKEIGAALGNAFWETGIFVALVAFALITIVIFIFFREIVPTIAIIAAASFDILGGIGLMSFFGIPLSLVSIPALLMLVGYSVDTDILLTTRVLKRKGKTPADRAGESMKTGLTMTSTTFVALLSMLIISYFTQISVIFEITAVLLFGLAADTISTWFMNAPLLLWYAEKKGVK